MTLDALTLAAFRDELEKVAMRPRALPTEKMDRASWKQTARDFPVVVAATGVGYGLGRTMADVAGKHFGDKARMGQPPGWAKHLPLASALAANMASYSMGRTSKALKERREDARKKAKTAGVPPNPRARHLARKREDPWRYDPRPASLL